MSVEIGTFEELRARVGHEVATSDWIDVTQGRIDGFAASTGDRQWIHVDAARAAAGPFGGTIAHGLLTLSLLNALRVSAVVVAEASRGVNYGLNKVRFMTPVPAGGRMRGRFTLVALDDVPGGVQATWRAVAELQGSDKPACVAEMVSRMYR